MIEQEEAYNVSGNKGIQLVFTNGRKLLIGTKRPEEVKEILEKLGLFDFIASKIVRK